MVRPFIIGELYVCLIIYVFVCYFKCRDLMFTNEFYDVFIIPSEIKFCLLCFVFFTCS